jgi:hypothetical protein
MVRTGKVVLAAAALCAAAALPALAQQQPPRPGQTKQVEVEEPPPEPSRLETVTTRRREEYDPIGIRMGSFVAMPSLTFEPQFNDNIFKTDTNKDSDFIFGVTPAISVNSDWNRHFLRLYGDVSSGTYLDHGDENFLDATAGFDGRVDIQRDTYASGGFVWQKLHEDRGSPDDVGGTEPTEYYLYRPTLGFFNRWNRVSIKLDGEAGIYDYDDTPGTLGTINQDDRDRTRYVVGGRLGYELVPEYEAFIRGNFNTVKYDSSTDDFGFRRDSDGYEVGVGARVDLTGLMFADFFVGYVSQSYDDARLAKIDGVNFGGTVTWNMTTLTTIKGFATRTVEETTLSGASGSLDTEIGASVDHELLRNVILSANASFLNTDYEGITREDDYMKLGIGGRYLVNRNLYVTLKYNYLSRDSNVAGEDYSQNVVLLGLTGQM